MIPDSSDNPSTKKISEPTLPGSGSEIFFYSSPASNRPRIALVASIAWTLWNYRRTLINALESAGFEVILLAAEDEARLKLTGTTGARFIPLQHLSRRSLGLWQNMKSLIEMYRRFRQIKPDAVLLFTVRPNTLGNFAAAAAGIPSISTIEGMGITGSAASWLRHTTRLLYTWAFRHTSRVIFLNINDLQDFVAQKIVLKEKARLVPGPGIDLQYFLPSDGRTSANPLRFLFAGRLLSEKGIREFADAARHLRQKGLNAEFLVLGDTDPGNPTSLDPAEINSWVQEGFLQHLGFLEDVRPAIAAADVLVLPSYYREGVPRTVLEAMSMAKPVITTDNVGCRDTVENGKNGFLIPVRDVPALMDAMEKMATLPAQTRMEMGEYSRQKAEKEFADTLVIPAYLDLIREILPARLK